MEKRQSIPVAWKLDALKRHGAIVPCSICFHAVALDDVDYDHHRALIDDGSHESVNIRPVCRSCHKQKSAHEHKENSRAKRRAKAQAVHEAVVARVMTREPSRLKEVQWRSGATYIAAKSRKGSGVLWEHKR